jgi:hypothetical protein
MKQFQYLQRLVAPEVIFLLVALLASHYKLILKK